MYNYYSGTTVIPTHTGRQSTRVTPFRLFFGNNSSRLVTNIQAQSNNSRPAPAPICPTESLEPTPVYHLPGDIPLNLHEYMVVLEKPVGITLAPDPRTGEVVVQAIKPGSPAANSGLIQIGDVVRCCSAVFGDDMWGVPDVKPVSWAINNRMGDVRLVMERRRRGARRSGPSGPTSWYFQGKNALATFGRSYMYLPYGCPPTFAENYYTDLYGKGQNLYVTFHRTIPVPRKYVAPAVVISAARTAAVAHLRLELLEASGRPQLLEGMPAGPQGRSYTFIPPDTNPTGPDTGTGDAATAGNSSDKDSSPPPPDTAPSAADSMGDDSPPPPEVNVIDPTPEALSSGREEVGTGNGAVGVGSDGEEARSNHRIAGSGGDAGAAAAAIMATGDAPTSLQTADDSSKGAAPAPSTGSGKAPRVIPFLSWLLVSSGSLEHKHINFIASVCRLGCLLELSLTRGQQQTGESAGAAGTAAKDKNGSSSTNDNNNSDDSSGGGGGRGSNGLASGKPAAAAGGGGYLIVRGSNLTPLFSDIGRVWYPALLAKATAAKEGSGGDAPTGEAQTSGSSSAALSATIQAGNVGDADTGEPTAIRLTATSGGSLSPGDNVSNGNDSSGTNGSHTDNGTATSTLAFPNRNFLPNLSPPFVSGQMTANNPDGSIGGGRSAAAADVTSPTDPPPVKQHAQQYDPARVRHLINAAASLQRLVFRRGARLHHMRRNACAVLLHCDEGMEEEVAALLAGWLHWYGKLPLQEASLAAETALEVTVDHGLLEVATAALLEGARNRATRVVIKWRTGEADPCVTGDVVGSWSTRVPLVPCRSPMGCKGDTQLGHYYLEIYGLPPGVYTYKFIVGGRWTIDRYAPKVLDADRNLNNILRVPEPPQVLTSREGLALARWQAACLAFEAKMGLGGLQG